MNVDLALLKQEIINDPMNLGFSSYVSIRNDVEVTNLLNTIVELEDFKVNRGRITKDSFIEITSQIIYSLMLEHKNGNEQAKFWLDVFDRLVANSDTISCEDPSLIFVMNQMNSDNLITENQINSILNRYGSRSEKLFGRHVTIDEVSNSLNEGDI